MKKFYTKLVIRSQIYSVTKTQTGRDQSADLTN